MMIDCRVTDQSIDTDAMIRLAEDPECGACVVFAGNVRATSAGHTGRVIRLEYQAYEPMARQEMQNICHQAAVNWDVRHLLVWHRTGVLDVGQTAVAVVVAAAHRDAAYQASRYIIEELKKRVPIWKKEVFQDGQTWVNAHP